MPICSAVLTSPENLVRVALGLSSNYPVVAKPVNGNHRNLSFEVLSPCWAFLKVSRNSNNDYDAFREATCLEALNGCFPAPRLISCSSAEIDSSSYILTEGQPGTSLETILSYGAPGAIDLSLQRLLALLEKFRGLQNLESTLRLYEDRLIGPYDPHFSPAGWIREMQPGLSSLACYLSDPPVSLIHGSASANNVLVRCASNDVDLWLLDFEAVRRGPLGYDEAVVWYGLFSDGYKQWAAEWLRKILLQRNVQLISGFFANAVWLAALRMAEGASFTASEIGVAADAHGILESAMRAARVERTLC